MENVLQGLKDTVVFLDDILVTGQNDREHLNNLNNVIKRLSENGLKVQRNKCEFMKESIAYLGYVIDKCGLHTEKNKVDAIKNCPIPTTLMQLKSFLGMVNYYAKFIKKISTVLRPLYELLRANVKFVWTRERDEAFNKIKKLLINSPILTHYDGNMPLLLANIARFIKKYCQLCLELKNFIIIYMGAILYY